MFIFSLSDSNIGVSVVIYKTIGMLFGTGNEGDASRYACVLKVRLVSCAVVSEPVVALAFEEMRTPYESGREICVQKSVNAYQPKEIEKRMPHFKRTSRIQ